VVLEAASAIDEGVVEDDLLPPWKGLVGKGVNKLPNLYLILFRPDATVRILHKNSNIDLARERKSKRCEDRC
jgi:hypothetical protein